MSLWPWLILVTAYGACVGSFLNVVIYRLPVGENLVLPASACPKCGYKLAWYDNVPVLSWVLLRGRCRRCRQPISIQYPIIEALTATLFGSLFAMYFMTDQQPIWLARGLWSTWPVFAAHLVLIAALTAATMIDAKWYIIPLAIPRVVTMVAWAGLPLAAIAFEQVPQLAPSTSSGAVVVSIAGAVVGLAAANGLVAWGRLPRSFDQLPPTMDSVNEVEAADTGAHEAFELWAALGRESLFAATVIFLGLLVFFLQRATGYTTENTPLLPLFSATTVLWVLVAVIAAAAAAALLRARQQRKLAGADPSDAKSDVPDAAAGDWLNHPSPRREVLKECLFLVFPISGALLALWAGLRYSWQVPPPVGVLAGCVFGYLVGGATVWTTRIFGTLAFGKEAMGLGDVHLLGAIGAVLGWQNAVVAFFLAPFFGLLAALLTVGAGKILKGQVRVIPYGPYLAGAAVVQLYLGTDQILLFFGILTAP